MAQEDAEALLAVAKDTLRDTLQHLLATGADPSEHVLMVIAENDGTTVGVCSLAEYTREVILNDGPPGLAAWLEQPLPADHQRVVVIVGNATHPYAVPVTGSSTAGLRPDR